MLLRLVILLSLLFGTAQAKPVKLLNIPDNFYYISETDTVPYEVRFAGVENGLYRFDSYDPDGGREQTPYHSLWVSQFGPGLREGYTNDYTTYTPSDCYHIEGECRYFVEWSDGATNEAVTYTWYHGKYMFRETYVVYDSGPDFWYLDCLIPGRYGFALNFYQIDYEGLTLWQRRVDSSTGEVALISAEQMAEVCHRVYDNVMGKLN